MTLILAVITPEYVLGASDRRLVMPPKMTVHDDDATKLVLLNNHTVFAYTGLAKLPRSRAVINERGGSAEWINTNLWLAEVLSLGKGDLGRSLDALYNEATAVLRLAPNVQVAFVGVGWHRPSEGEELKPVAYVLSNLEDPSRFTPRTIQLGDNLPYASLTSKPFDRQVLATHERRLRAAFERGGQPSAVGRILTETIRSAADHDVTIGRGILQACIPRQPLVSALKTGKWQVAGTAPTLDYLTFNYLPPGTEGDGEPHGPTIAWGGIVSGELLVGKDPLNVESGIETAPQSESR